MAGTGLREARKAQRARTAGQSRGRVRFGRLQWVALLVGLFHLLTAYHPLLSFDTSDPLLRVCTGFCGVLMARRRQDARRFGIALVLGYGGLVLAQFAGPDRLEPVTLVYARTALSGVLIIALSVRGAGSATRGSAG